MKQCEKCHTENNEEAAYCKNCGHVLEMSKTNQVVKFQTTFSKINIVALWSFRVLVSTFLLLLLTGFLHDHYDGLTGEIYFEYSTQYDKTSNFIPDEVNGYISIDELNYEERRSSLISLVGNAKAEPLIKLSEEYHDAVSKRELFTILSIIFGIFQLSLPLLIVFFFIFNKRWKKFYLNSDFKNAKERLTAFAFSQNKSDETVKIRENPKDELRLKDKSLGAKGYFHLVTDKEGNVLLIGEKYNTQSLIRTVFGKDINFIEK